GLTWTAPSSNGGPAVTPYRVYPAPTSGAGTLLPPGGTATGYTHSTAAHGPTPFYKASAVNPAAEGTAPKNAPAPPPTTPGAPTLTTATGGSNSVALTWTAPTSNGGSAITGYRVYRGTTSGAETLLTTVGTVTSYTDTTAVNGTTYYYEVSAVNAVGES